jgi:hypothetical protein
LPGKDKALIVDGAAVEVDFRTRSDRFNLAAASDRGRAVDDQRRRIAVDNDCAVVDQSVGKPMLVGPSML